MPYSKADLIEMTRSAARRYDIREDVAVAQIGQESSWNPNARSGAGAEGLAQFTPATWATYGKGSPYDPVAALDAWGKYMRHLLNKFGGNYSYALAGYDAGEGRVTKYGGVPPFAETKHYVATILAKAGSAIQSGATSVAAAGTYATEHPQIAGGGIAIAVLGAALLLLLIKE